MNNEGLNIKLSGYLSRHREILFPAAACRYVCECVFAALRGHGPGCHVTAAEILGTFRKRCAADFGPWAAEILAAWHITKPLHVGEIVFILVDAGELTTREEDRLEDFALDDASFVIPWPVLRHPEENIRWEAAAID